MNESGAKIVLEKMTIERLAPQLLFASVKDNITIEVEDVYEVKAANQKLAQGKDYVVIFEAGKFSNPTTEARELMASEDIGKNGLALGFVIKSLSQRILRNFYIQIDRPPTPTKLFNNVEDALTWGKSFIPTNQ